eukprot:2237767-Rhodomonas_salina.1
MRTTRPVVPYAISVPDIAWHARRQLVAAYDLLVPGNAQHTRRHVAITCAHCQRNHGCERHHTVSPPLSVKARAVYNESRGAG